MAAPKGTIPPSAGKGRVKGTVNKNTKALKDMILSALDSAGGERYLTSQAQENPVAFMTLIGKVLPSEVKASLTDGQGGPAKIIVEYVTASERPR